ncbi:uncharacterized protein LOC114247734 isoform X1 [Bombyx mandarina]|uniref:Uncharacterized protein LOC114247734 isoform X1 n=1 Tax=Bombyx mandarina TaxID=7092 RepID=A0A6J2K3Q6_BOMMA|nr:uncharacterized protein LOC114247734 isoform X1 [Bombyx mandarina]
MRTIDAGQISVPLRHITKHDIKMIPNEVMHELPAINSEADPPGAPATPRPVDDHHSSRPLALSPTSAVRGMFPSSKSRSLKKKSSILAKRRQVAARWVGARGAGGAVWQRVRAGGAAPRWVARTLLLAHNLLYAYRSPECSKADCMIYLEGFTVCAAGEVKSRAHAFKVYHTGTAFYFACESRDDMLAWIQLIHRATMLPSLGHQLDVSKQFSETDYSETESDSESPDKRSEKEKEKDKEKDKDKEKEKDKDKSKFGSLKKLTHMMQRSESQEIVSHSSTSLDRKYLRFFLRNKSKDETKPAKVSRTPSPGHARGPPLSHSRQFCTAHCDLSQSKPAPPEQARGPPEHARGPPEQARGPPEQARGPPEQARSPARAPPEPLANKIPKPINYIHASNPNLLDFEKSDFVTRPTLRVPRPEPKLDKGPGAVTLEQFMLEKQAEERRQLYSERVLLGVRRDLQTRLDSIVPDVIYGEVRTGSNSAVQGRALPSAPSAPTTAPSAHSSTTPKPVSVRGRDGYERLVYRAEEKPAWGRNHKVHSALPAAPQSPRARTTDSWAGAEGGVSRLRLVFGAHQSGPRAEYPHLVCPPTFRAETYSLQHAPAPDT